MSTSLSERLDRFENVYGKFNEMEETHKRAPRRDLHAFLLLNELVPGTAPIVSAAEHDEIYLDTSVEQLNAVISDAQVEEMARCSVRYHDDYDCLALYV